MKKITNSFAVLYVLFSFNTSIAQTRYEFRAAWVATVDNIDWPTRGNYSTAVQKKEFIALLDMHKRNGMNAVIVQIRPATDAFYPSQYEPWSEWLTGKQGRPPSPYYDPLEFMIAETHQRGMEFHAWCNPYRAEFNIGNSSIASTHITKIHPEWFLKYGDKRYFDPGNKEGQEFVVKVIRDIVNRYDLDGVHFDDYFYPYRIAGKEFPDSRTFRLYGNGMARDDWRRSNTDSIIIKLSRAIKEEKKHCRFGISPFGVWRNQDKDPEGSATRAGVTNYDDLYADILLWLKNGWIDYVAPQLYWEFGHKAAPFEVLLDWWSKHTYGKHCYIGLGIYRAGSNSVWKDSTLIPRQLTALRNTPNIQGAIYFSSKTFIRNPNGWSDSLQNNYYKYPALVPPMEWLDDPVPEAPQLKVWTDPASESLQVEILDCNPSFKTKSFVVYSFGNTDTLQDIFNPDNILHIIPSSGGLITINIPRPAKNFKQIAVACIDTSNKESELTYLNIPWQPLNARSSGHKMFMQ